MKLTLCQRKNDTGRKYSDNGGLKQSFRAYRKWVSQHGEELDLPDLVRFDETEDALSKVRSSVHSPGPIRVLGPLSNSHDFAKAYNCPVGSPMNPTDKCSVW
nr:unnamed protein product [Callosobruchus chinensis]